MCPRRLTYCPLCRLPLTAAEIAESPPEEYPTHYACRVALQQAEEWMDAEDQEREYRGAEEDRDQ